MSCRGFHRVSLTGVCCIPRYRLASILLLICAHNDELLECWLSIRQYSTITAAAYLGDASLLTTKIVFCCCESDRPQFPPCCTENSTSSKISCRGIAKRTMTNILSAVGGSEVDQVSVFATRMENHYIHWLVRVRATVGWVA